jgi:NTE family protein
MDAAYARQGANHRTINLALQGGGAHGAFTWGVLDRLLEEERLVIEGISGSSGGAINAALLAHGMSIGGADEARASLDRFWRRMSELGWLNPIRRGWLEKMQGSWNLDRSPVALMVEEMALLLSPGQTEAFSHNQLHLRELIEESIDIVALREQKAIKLFVGATHVRTGQPRIFYGDELSVDAFLASACVPQFYPTVIIDGEAYWDGGYLGNPPLWPLIYECKSRDIMIVQVHPIRRDEVPRNSAEITNRLNEIVFNAALMAQLRALSIVTQTMNQFGAVGSRASGVRKKTFLIHLIEAEQAMKSLGMLSELNTDLDFLLYLKELGRTSANHWLDSHLHDINQNSTFDIDALLLDTGSKSAPLLTWPDA